MGYRELYEDEESYAEAKMKAWKAEQENRKFINYRKHFNTALYETTSDVFKQLTNNKMIH